MGLALRDVNESLAGSLGIAEGTTEYMNMTSSVSDTVENFIGDGSAISTKLTEELYKLTSEVKDTIRMNIVISCYFDSYLHQILL
eukprot:COSAG05_NODE_46_length_25233_cov_40.235741_11_plen_85_part_00